MPSITQTLAAETIAERLRETMKTQGITSVQLARMAGIKTSFLYDVLRRKSHNPSIIRLARVAEALEVPLTYLVGKDPPPLPAHEHYPAQKMVTVPYITAENQKIVTAPSALPPLCFHAGWLQEGQLLRDAHKLKDIPGTIVHGRYDMPCPARYAWALHKAWPKADFHLIEGAGHAYSEPGILDRLIRATDKFAGK